MEGLLFQAFIYLVAAVVAVPIANRLGLGSVLGYLIAGVVIGPVLGIVGETEDLQHVAEFGVVMMLFLVGLELEPKNLWEMRHRLFGLGGLQVVVTTLAISGAGYAIGLPWQVALAVGMMLSLSSTAIVLQTLGEKGLTRSEGGEASFSILLFQDVVVILMLALIPLLVVSPETIHFVGQSFATFGETGEILVQSTQANGGEASPASSELIGNLPAWAKTLAVLAAVAVVVFGGHYLTQPVFRFIAQTRMREIFTAAALLLIVGIAVLMSMVGLSPALGTFLAGVVLANSEYRHELESDIEPFKGLLLGLFFITVGAGINFTVLAEHFFVIMAIVLGLILIKGLILYSLGFAFRIRGSARWLLAFGMAQAGEFGFVLLGFSLQSKVIPKELGEQLSLVIALSMLLTPALFILYERFIGSRIETVEPDYDDIDMEGTVIVAGLGRFGQVVNRMLLSHGHKTVVLDYQHETISGMRKFGVRAFFGDPSRPDLLIAAGIRNAKAIVVAIDEPEKATQIVEHVRREYPEVKIIVRAKDRSHVYELYAAGAREIVRETFDSAVRAGKNTLEALGHHPFDVEKSARVFVQEDRRMLAELAQVWEPGVSVYDNDAYMARAHEQAALLEKAMKGRDTEAQDRIERSWTPPPKGGKSSE